MSFQRLDGLNYPRLLRRLHAKHHFEWYLEVGCRDGRTAALSRSKSIMVDPFFVAEQNIIGAKPALFCFQQTSDAFFASNVLKQLKAKISVAFLDGMHLFEFLLRDIYNTEAHATKDSVIFLHDCYPQNIDMTTRDHASLGKKSAWTGDVWKLLPILRAYRPEIDITTLSCRPTGLVVLSNLNPRSTKLKRSYDQIVADYEALTIEDFGIDNFTEAFPLVEPLNWLETTTVFDKITLAGDSFEAPEYVSP